jgi:hypothetical protein
VSCEHYTAFQLWKSRYKTSVRKPTIFSEVLCGSSVRSENCQFITPQILPLPIPSTSFPINYSLRNRYHISWATDMVWK